MNNCPCCSSTLLRHVRHSQIYWYCPHCKEEMPNLRDWILAKTIVSPVKQHSIQAQKALSLTSVKTRVSEPKPIESWLIQETEKTPVCC